MNQSILFSFTKPKEIKLLVILHGAKPDLKYIEDVQVKNKNHPEKTNAQKNLQWLRSQEALILCNGSSCPTICQFWQPFPDNYCQCS